MVKILPLVLFLMFISSCDKVEKKVMFTGEAQGTYYAITYFDDEERNLQPEVDSLLKSFDRSVSLWIPSSVISRVNANDSSVILDPWFIEIFDLSRKVSEKTNGAFDATVGPLVNAWGFGFKGKIKMDSLIVDSLMKYIDYKAVNIINGKLVKEHPGIKLDFNAIAQGYSVDLVRKLIESKGIRNYLIDIGGEVYAKGRKPGHQKWTVGIEKPSYNPDDERSIQVRVELEQKALATSGNYRKFYEENGIKYSHTIDPSNGYPVSHNLLSVSVIADNTALADAYATAFMVMGVEKAKTFLDENDEMEAYFISSKRDGGFVIDMSEGFKKYLLDSNQ